MVAISSQMLVWPKKPACRLFVVLVVSEKESFGVCKLTTCMAIISRRHQNKPTKPSYRLATAR